MSWRHYCYGLQVLGRFHLRDLKRAAEAARLAQATQDDYQKAQADLQRCLTVPRERSDG